MALQAYTLKAVLGAGWFATPLRYHLQRQDVIWLRATCKCLWASPELKRSQALLLWARARCASCGILPIGLRTCLFHTRKELTLVITSRRHDGALLELDNDREHASAVRAMLTALRSDKDKLTALH